ncbi:phospholipid:lipid A palmitoyltransferase [Jeongeupia wiesaeckerbachi]|uniref:lipid IV(A) palmitoyltransferase PagP n=1 Tax=Jeongeupia wiesaeckerbachi TaxID=3051218 RepID=UPI003D800CA6
MKRWLATAATTLALASPAQADCGNMGEWLGSACSHVNKIADEGSWDLYLTGYTWHDPHTWTDEKLEELNAKAWGGGLGKRLVDENGNQDLLYGMVFSDSHEDPQLMLGYAKVWYWPSTSIVSVGAGYTVGLTSRADILNRIPFPYILPVLSLRVWRASLMGTFIPSLNSGLNSGNVGFVFGRYEFK